MAPKVGRYILGDIKLVTEIPGPLSQDFMKKREEAIPRALTHTVPIFAHHAHGALVTDIDGNQFIDLAGGISSLNVGHSPSLVTDALKAQLDRFIHPVFPVTLYDSYVELAEALNKRAPGDFAKKTVFFNSGAEAVENAVKIARRYTGRRGIIAFERGFHGRTLLTMSLTGKVRNFKYGFGSMAGDIYHMPYPYAYRGILNDDEILARFDDLFESVVLPEDVAAIIMEPVQGDGGFVVPTKKFVQGVKRICEKHDILFIADEVQTGFGRTGKWFGIEHFEVEPDLITMSKSIGAGIPLSAVTGRREVMDAPMPKEIGSTLGGSPLGCVAGLKVIEMIEKENLLSRAGQIGDKIREKLSDSSVHIGEVRGIGAMVGIEFVKDRESKEPDAVFTKAVVKHCYEKGVIVLTAGSRGNVIRLLPPLVITDAQIEEAMQVFVSVVQDLEGVVSIG
jgi:4-aminobutyrate aminotransferase / (S)-3-amino-2-methylpropionate transaminase / 5-aminovalerate transaminase